MGRSSHNVDQLLTRSFRGRWPGAAFLVMAGFLVALVLLDVSDFRSVLARGWHGPCRSRERPPSPRSAAGIGLYVAAPYHAEVDHLIPSGEHGHDGGSFYGGFFIEGSPEEAAHLVALRERFGDEMVDRLQRGRELMRHPRPLTDSEHEVIRNAMAPVLQDLEASSVIVPEVLYEAHEDTGRDGREGVHAWITAGGIGGMGMWIPTEETSFAEQVRWLADQVQEWEVEELSRAGRSATWPECPEHPNSHPLLPDVDSLDGAVWRCPRSGQVMCAIGALGAH